MAIAVNCLVTDPIWKMVAGPFGVLVARSARPYPASRSTCPLRATSTVPENRPDEARPSRYLAIGARPATGRVGIEPAALEGREAGATPDPTATLLRVHEVVAMPKTATAASTAREARRARIPLIQSERRWRA